MTNTKYLTPVLRTIHDEYFYGNKVSEYGIEHHRVDYATLSKAFPHILNNDIVPETYEYAEWEVVNGLDNEDIYELEVFQYYIIDYSGYVILKTWTDEVVYYNEKLNLYVWGVSHWGTAWDYVLTDIKISQ